MAGFKHMLRAGPGRLVFGVAAAGGDSLVAVGKGLPGCRLRRIPLAALFRAGAGDALADEADAWIAHFTSAVVRDVDPHPRPDLRLAADERQDVAAGAVVSAAAGVLWVDGKGAAGFLGTEDPAPDGPGVLPVTQQSWLVTSGPACLAGVSSRTLSDDGRLLPALAEFHRAALGAERLNRRLALVDDANLQRSAAAHRRLDVEQARRGLFSVLRPERFPAGDHGSALSAALTLIGRHEGIAFRAPPRRSGPGSDEPSVQELLWFSNARYREVALDAEEGWWRGDSGPLLAFRSEDGRPVALLPRAAGGYRLVDPTAGCSTRVDAECAGGLDRRAFFFYRLLADRPVGARDVLGFAGRNVAADFSRCAAAGTVSGVVTLAPAVALGILADHALPVADRGMLVRMVVALVVAALAGALCHVLQGTALMRLEGRAAALLGAALWDRVLRLRSDFFENLTAGELSVRLAVFQVLRDQVSGVVASTVLSVVFLLPAFLLIFLYDVVLGWMSLGLGLVFLIVAFVCGLRQMTPRRMRYAAARDLAGGLLQFIGGLGKLRSSGAEGAAFSAWARNYRKQQDATMRIGDLSEHVVALGAALPALATGLLFALVLWRGPEGLAVGDFLVVYAASMLFHQTLVRFGGSFETVADILPAVSQVQPIIEATPHAPPAGRAVVTLDGGIRFDHVSFRYERDGALILDDVSLHARAGEFIAIVGETGSGKSTLVRLALGLLEPSVGAVYFDEQDLAHLDPQAVRRQIGVVMQNGGLRPGNVLDNIIGTAPHLTVEDAWRAARLAAVDRDISAMPMGMFTLVGDGGASFSGGQVQRIMIAAALVRQPRMLVLDEATSWLDAESQRKITAGIEDLAVTRIVIAHRLSTIRRANRIYVLRRGRVVQHGAFDELFEVEGAFRNLMRRQMT